MTRADGRAVNQLRPLTLTRGWSKFAEGSCIIEMGNTRVLCTASIDETVPMWMKNSQRGWITSEYGMLPRSTPQRTPRESTRGRPDGRSLEIQRLVGRSLRAVTNLNGLGERTIYLDCDVLQADGGTRTASITAAYVALVEAIASLRAKNRIKGMPISTNVAAVSVGLIGNQPLLDLDFQEDSKADVDMNVVMSGTGRLIEVQATGEGSTFTDAQLQNLIALARTGIEQIIDRQNAVVKDLL